MEKLRREILKKLKKIGIRTAENVQFTYPTDLQHGDFTSNIALISAKETGKSPRQLAEELVGLIDEKKPESIEKIEVAGPGFINIYLTRNTFSTVVNEIDENWGKTTGNKSLRIVVEYSQPNPFKPFHIGHLMSTSIGESISRCIEWTGAEIFRANYQGDIGPHVAKCLWGLQKIRKDASNITDLGEAYVYGNSAYENDEEAKQEIDDLNKTLYAQDDPELKKIYDVGRKTSIDRFSELYDVLGTRFDRYYFESEVTPMIEEIVRGALEKSVLEKSNGAVVYHGERRGLHTRVFITSKGTPTYEAKELALVQQKRLDFPFDLNITTVAIEQDGYFKVIEAVLAELWPEIAGTYTHETFGMMTLTSGKMSSRKGNVITGESLIENMREKALKKMTGRQFDSETERRAIADAVAVAAIKYSILKQSKGKNIIFDPEQSLSIEGDSGPYLQYSYVRAKSVLERAGDKNIKVENVGIPENVPVFERLLPRFPMIVERAAKDREPHYITTYLTELASAFNSWYVSERIIGSEHETYNLTLTRAFAQTIKNGLWLLGIKTPDKM